MSLDCANVVRIPMWDKRSRVIKFFIPIIYGCFTIFPGLCYMPGNECWGFEASKITVNIIFMQVDSLLFACN